MKSFLYTFAVALRTEGVDRNIHDRDAIGYTPVALRTEGVDRNAYVVAFL